jgi:hypothetical protein
VRWLDDGGAASGDGRSSVRGGPHRRRRRAVTGGGRRGERVCFAFSFLHEVRPSRDSFFSGGYNWPEVAAVAAAAR